MTDPLKKISTAAGKINVLAIFILTAELFIILYLICQRRLVSHDSLDHFTFQYYFLNNVVSAGEVPRWMPYLAHGVPAAWWYSISGSGSLLHNVLLHTGPMLKSINFLIIYYAGIFIDHLFLLAGTWLLGRLFYTSAFTRAFVSLTVIGSSVWFSNIYYNFHSYYMIPLILYFIHRFLNTGEYKKLFLAANLFFLQIITNLPYFAPVVSLFIFLYFLFFIIINRPMPRINSLKPPRHLLFFIQLALTGIFAMAVYSLLKLGITPDQVINFKGRADQGGVSLGTYLKSGDFSYLKSCLDLGVGVSPAVDFTFYIGLIPLILLFFLRIDRKNMHIVLLITAILLFCAGSFLSKLFYYWPFMAYFRHLTPTLALAKLFLCFLIGFGLDRCIIRGFPKTSKIFSNALLIIAGALFLWGYFSLNDLASHKGRAQSLLAFIVPPPNSQYIFTSDEIRRLFHRTAHFMLLFSFACPVIAFLKGRDIKSQALCFLLLVQCLDLYTYKFEQIKIRTRKLNNLQYQILHFEPLPYREKRHPFALDKNNREWRFNLQSFSGKGTIYHTIHGFLFFKDHLDLSSDSYNWLKPLHIYLKAYWENAPTTTKRPIEDPENRVITFPLQNLAANKISGFTENKIQFFSSAYLGGSEQELGNLITDPSYKGDLLFLSPLIAQNLNDPIIQPRPPDLALSSNERIRLPYTVIQFNSNHIIITVDVPGEEKNVWLFYSNTWHTGWSAKINGQTAPVFRANLAYQAVPLQSGHNVIRLSFHSLFLKILYGLLALNSLFWIGLVFQLIGKPLTEQSLNNGV